MLTSYHNHTTWSDGTANVAAMIGGAGKAGLDEIGISDHFVLARDSRKCDWSMDPESLEEYAAQIRTEGANAGGISVRLSLEVDYIPETIGVVQRRLETISFDYLIASVHFIDDFPIDLDSRQWEGRSEDFRNAVWRMYWKRLQAAAGTRFFDIAGHFDLPKKFGYFPSIDLTKEALEALDAIAAAGMAIEINTAGWNKPVQEAYPSLFYLKEARRREIPLVINADAHRTEDLVRHFDRARRLALDAGYSELTRFDRRRRFSYPLEASSS